MRCAQVQDWLRELTAYPTPQKIANYLQGELAAVETEGAAGAADAAASLPRKHLRRCPRCLARMRRALKYWSLLALFGRDVTPGPGLERRLAERLRAPIAATASIPAPLPPERPRGPASAEEESLYRDSAGAVPVTGWLLAVAGRFRGADLNLAPGENAIGRDPACDLVVDDPSVSPRHASIVCAVGAAGIAYFLLDHASERGTFLNGGDARVGWARLEDNDAIRLGDVRLKLKTLVGVPAE